MTTPLPPIYRDCRRLLVFTEDMVRQFSRYHKYTVGTDLRQQAMKLMRTVNQAVHDKPHQMQHVQALVWRVDEFKLTLQLCMEIGAFSQSPRGQNGSGRKGRGGVGFHLLEQAADLAAVIGKQCGAWGQALARRQHAKQVTPATPTGEPMAAGHAPEPARGAGSQPQPQAAAVTRFTEWVHPLGCGAAPQWGSTWPGGQTMTKPCYPPDAWLRRKCVPWRPRPMSATPTTPGTSISTMATSTTTTATTTRFAWCGPVRGAFGAKR